MLSETKISSEYSTVVPSKIRKALGITPGDRLEWELKGDKLMVRHKKKVTLEDIVGFIDVGGDAVEAKRRIQRGLR